MVCRLMLLKLEGSTKYMADAVKLEGTCMCVCGGGGEGGIPEYATLCMKAL